MESSMADANQQYFFPLMRSLGQTSLWYDNDDVQPDDVNREHLLATRWVVGSPESVTRQLRALYADVGGFGELLMVCYDRDGTNGQRWRHSMDAGSGGTAATGRPDGIQ
jgi:alkanesulfonate monooxygenase SsuD/methylene tetrahydromethanopterin reductase-like flavin-dependent oxidoreductase (luciferase family)